MSVYGSVSDFSNSINMVVNPLCRLDRPMPQPIPNIVQRVVLFLVHHSVGYAVRAREEPNFMCDC